ncbi:MAG: hypothetical protein MUO23_08680 [Anaerolineales bacterium]|nr:hypothetical protein [Anaerolineales bacterium]
MSKKPTLIGTGGILALLLFVAGSAILGLVLGGHDPSVRRAMGLRTGERNLSAALVVSPKILAGTNTLAFVLVGAIAVLPVLMATARRLGAGAPPAVGDGS